MSRLFAMRFPFVNLLDELSYEELMVEKVGVVYRVRRLPFFVQEIALNDLVSAESRVGVLTFKYKIQASGNSTFQITIYKGEYLEALLTFINQMSCIYDASCIKNCVAVSVPNTADYKGILDFLMAQSKHSILHVNEACIYK